MRTKRVVRIVLCSPGDVKDERQVMESVIDELNDDIADELNATLELSRWETDAHPGFHPEGPQGLIDPILNIEESDVVLGIFWNRFGTPTQDARSGTEHELRKAIECHRERKRPQVMIYFKEKPYSPRTREECNQKGLVIEFREEFPPEGLYWTFTEVLEFQRLARQHLTRYLRFLIRGDAEVSASGTREPSERGLILDYCRGMRDRFATIYLFGRRAASSGGGKTSPDHMATMEQGFVPMLLSEWRETDGEADGEPIRIEDLFSDRGQAPRILVRGLPGAGKTTLLRNLGHHLATQALESGKESIPVYARLRDFKCGGTTLEEFVCQQIDADSDGSRPEMCAALCEDERFMKRSMVLLLDGLDEIEDEETEGKIGRMLHELARKHPHCGIVLTSRPIGLRREDYRRYRALDLLPLTEAMTADYLHRWFAGDGSAIADLQDVFARRPRIRSLAANPFLLSMICFTYEGGGRAELVERRSQLYESCTRELLQRAYDPEDVSLSRMKVEDALAVLKDLSLRFFLWQEADFHPDHVKVIVAHNPNAADLGGTEAFLDRLQRQTGLVQRVKGGYTFIHRSLWEYFTALALIDKGRRRHDFVIRQAANPDWEEVVRLYAGLLSRDDAVKTLVKGLWNINRPLALRVTTEVRTPAGELIRPLIEQEQGNQGRLLLINSLEQSLPLVPDGERRTIVEETLRILLLQCAERDCQVIFHAQTLLETMGLQPLQPGGVIFDLLDLGNAQARQEELLLDPANHFQWIEVEGGSFMMGDDQHGEDEKPAHPVQVGSFLMARHPVTNRLLAGFPFGEKYPNIGSESHPAVGNTWYEAYYFALWLGARLPSESEWEYAARGGRHAGSTQYFFGDREKDLARHAWFGETGRDTAHAVDEVNPSTGRLNLNPVGLANIIGNVWEWAEDDWHLNYSGAPDDGRPWVDTPRGSDRVLRGGSWGSVARDCRSARRNYNAPGNRSADVGFRLSRSVALGP